MSRTYPANFSSYSEYYHYFKCFSNLKIGDLLEIYVYKPNPARPQTYAPSPTISDKTEIVHFSGFYTRNQKTLFDYVPMLSTNKNNIGFYQGKNHIRNLLGEPNQLNIINEFIFIGFDHHVKVKRIIKQ